jgi:hypothetical protein
MAKKKSRSVAKLIGEAIGDVVDAASVAATGSQFGVLELAAEEEFKRAPAKRRGKAKVARKKKIKTQSKKRPKKRHGVKRARGRSSTRAR